MYMPKQAHIQVLGSNDKYVYVMHSLVKMYNMHKSKTLQLTAFTTLEIFMYREDY